jgi:hypothetical protein
LTLEKSISRSDKWERAMKSTYAALSRLEENQPETIIELRALEANYAASYFRSWVGMPIKWRGTSRRPISENWHFIGQRSSPYHLAGNRNAAHPVNAIMNYAYAALESEIRIKALSEGYLLPPATGRPRTLHGCRVNSTGPDPSISGSAPGRAGMASDSAPVRQSLVPPCAVRPAARCWQRAGVEGETMAQAKYRHPGRFSCAGVSAAPSTHRTRRSRPAPGRSYCGSALRPA